MLEKYGIVSEVDSKGSRFNQKIKDAVHRQSREDVESVIAEFEAAYEHELKTSVE